MNFPNLHAELEAASVGSDRSAAARLRDHFDDVQAALIKGVKRATVRDILARHGLEMTFPTFIRTLARIRKERGIVMRSFKAAARSAAVAAPPVATHAPASADVPKAAAVVETKARASSQASAEVVTPSELQSRAALPDDWLVSRTLTREQKQLLTFDQIRQRADYKASLRTPEQQRGFDYSQQALARAMRAQQERDAANLQPASQASGTAQKKDGQS